MIYAWIKHLHIATVAFNIGFFILRCYWMLARSPLASQRWARHVSVFNDTLLLIAGIALAVLSAQYPFQAPWLSAKLLGLLAYILFGTLALKRGRHRPARIACGLIALLCAAYIVAAARYRSPLLPGPWY
ncbi:MAG: SirB2 family protein [Candidatus Sedimenticola endophacoides]